MFNQVEYLNMKVLLATSSDGNLQNCLSTLHLRSFLYTQQVNVRAFWEVILKRW